MRSIGLPGSASVLATRAAESMRASHSDVRTTFSTMGGSMHFHGAAAAAFALLAFTSPMQAQDRWGGPDKQRHFSISVAAGAVGVWAARDIFGAREHAPLLGAVLGQLPGLAREIYQARNNRFSSRDHVYNIAGAVVGAYFGTDLVFAPTMSRAGRTDGIIVHYRIRF